MINIKPNLSELCKHFQDFSGYNTNVPKHVYLLYVCNK